jgi:hypothetical protein
VFEVPQNGHYSAGFAKRGHRSAGTVLRALISGEVTDGRRERNGKRPTLPSRLESRPAGWFHEQADDCARQDKLNIRTEASGPMPTAPAMKELAAVRTQLRKDVLKIGCGGRGRAQRGWVERPTREREQYKSEQATSDFEPTADDVLVGHAITDEMKWQTQCHSGKPRASERAHRSTRRDMQRHDHDYPVGGPERTRCYLRRSADAGPAHPNRLRSESRRIAQCTTGWTTCAATQIRIRRGLLAARGLFRPFRLRWCLLGLGERLRTLLPGHVGLLSTLIGCRDHSDSTSASECSILALHLPGPLGKPGIVEPEPNKGNDPTRSSYDRGYWLRRCEGFLVETSTKRIGHVTGIRYGEATNEPETLEVRPGLFGRTRLLISVDDITEIDPEQDLLTLADPPRPLSSTPLRRLSRQHSPWAASRTVEW